MGHFDRGKSLTRRERSEPRRSSRQQVGWIGERGEEHTDCWVVDKYVAETAALNYELQREICNMTRMPRVVVGVEHKGTSQLNKAAGDMTSITWHT